MAEGDHPTPNDADAPEPVEDDDEQLASRDRGVSGWARRQQRMKEMALEPEERIKLALRLGMRARALRAKVGR